MNVDNSFESSDELSRNPLIEVEEDVRNLIKKYGELIHEFEAYKTKNDADAKRMLLLFIEVTDSFENVFNNVDPKIGSVDKRTKIWVNNFRTVYKILLRSTKRAGIVPIEVIIGEKANPYWHNVVEVAQVEGRGNETIIEEIKKGYLRNGKILRMAEVKTVKND